MSLVEFDDAEYASESAALDTSPLVERVIVRGLHGRFNYDLKLNTGMENGRLALFYGDNGSGKTTILRLMWDLLSPAPNKKHRSRVAKVAFEEFTVHLSSRVRITASRKLATAGPFEIEARRRGGLVSRSVWPERHHFEDVFDDWPVDAFPNRLKAMEPEVAEAGAAALAKRKYLELLKSLGSAPYYLADDRSTSSDELEAVRPAFDPRRARSQRDTSEVVKSTLADELERAFALVNTKLRRLALGGAVSGSAGANSVYVDVVRRLGSTQHLNSDPAESRRELTRSIRQIGEKSRPFEVLGLVPTFRSEEFIEALNAVPVHSVGVTRSILDPYLQSLVARLEALQESQRLIQALLDEANGFLTDKRLTYQSSRGGIRCELSDGTVLRASQLSSGECHVLLLLCNAVLAQGTARLFLIDEPELSLNVKWQRRIVRSLLNVTFGSGLQFILATHSIELLSGYRTRVVKLAAEDTPR